MNITSKYPIMIFRDDKNGFPVYSMGMSKAKEDKTYEKAYFPIRFKKGIELKNMTKINVKNAFLTFDKKTDNEGNNRTFTYVMVLDFEEEGNSLADFDDLITTEQADDELDWD